MAIIRVDMDRRWEFDIDTADTVKNIPPEIEVSDAFVMQFHRIQKEYNAMQEYLEHAFRYQNGLTPFKNSPFGLKKMGVVPKTDHEKD